MTLREKLHTDIEDFKRGFNDPSFDGYEGIRWSSWSDRLLVVPLELFRIALFGFIVASPGVPLVPWGSASGIALTLTAVAAAITLSLRRENPGALDVVLFAACLAIIALVKRDGDVATSILLAGAFLGMIVQGARTRPILYAYVALAVVLGLIAQALDVRLLAGGEAIFSGRTSTPDVVSREMLQLGALTFLSGMMHLHKAENDKQKALARAAEDARDHAVSNERARIARELHDVVSHHVTAMTLQSEAAAATGDSGALRAVAASGREALTELRRMLGVLRQPDAPDGTPARPEVAPQPDLQQLDLLVARARTGLDVHVSKVGEVRALPAGVELCAYRLVQEALTNTAKHSDARRADITLTYGADDLTVEVVDDGRALATARVASGGLGIIGMGERVALLDGELSAGPRSDGPGYRVVARLPLQA